VIVSRALMHTTVGRLTGFNLGALEGQVGEQVGKAADAARATASAAASTAADAGKQVLGTAQDAASGATKALKGLFSTGD